MPQKRRDWVYDKHKVTIGRLCCRCGAFHSRRHSKNTWQCYCKDCHADNMRRTRPKHSELLPIARAKVNARAYANVYLQRGKLEKQPCEVCGSPESQMHHDDYDKPLEVRWFCRPCHLEEHK